MSHTKPICLTMMANDDVNKIDSLESTTPLEQITAWCGDSIASKTPMEPAPLLDVLDWIRSKPLLAKAIADVRKIADKNARQSAKQNTLPYFTLNTFTDGQRKQDFLNSAKFCPLDFDGLTSTSIAGIFNQMKTDEDVMFAFHSPSGDGIKFFVELQEAVTNPQHYSEIYDGIRKRFEERYGVKADPSCRDCGRATYLSYDPDIYISKSHTLIPVVLYERETIPRKVNKEKVAQYFAGTTIGGRTDAICSLAGYLHWYGAPIEYALCATEELNGKNAEPLHTEKVESTVKYIYKKYPSRDVRPISEILRGFYSMGQDIYQGNINGSFSLSKIGLAKFYILTNAFDDRDRAKYLDHLVKQQHIPHLERVDEIGDIGTEQSYYEYSDSKFTVHYAPVKAEIEDNQFIENWLQSTFGMYKSFIKQWLAVYCYTNYKKLPTLILKGERGSAKNTFAECLMQIYPQISRGWHGEERHFSPEVSNKLLVADEKIAADEKQYNQLKRLSGQKYAVKEVKYMEPFQVVNNMNIVIMSNKFAPIFVSKDEQPTSAKNNQFFIYTMPVVPTEKIDNQFGEKAVKRLGHYIRTELKMVYESIKDRTDCRYTIECPITEDEKAIFNVNITGYEYEVEKILTKMIDTEDEAYTQFFDLGYFPGDFLNEYTLPHGYTKAGVIKKLKEHDCLKPTDPVQKQVHSRRTRCYEMTPKLRRRYQEGRGIPVATQPVATPEPRYTGVYCWA
jgi:hypothetical protein